MIRRNDQQFDTMEPLLRGHHDEKPPPLKRPLDNVNLNINVLISTPDERQPLLKGNFPGAKGVTSQKGFHRNVLMHFHSVTVTYRDRLDCALCRLE